MCVGCKWNINDFEFRNFEQVIKENENEMKNV